MSRRSILIFCLGAAPALALAAGDIPGATLVLEVVVPPRPGRLPAAAPPRFVLMEKGLFFVGGSDVIMAGRLEAGEIKAIENRLTRLRKLPGLGSQVSFGAGDTRYRLLLLEKRPLEILATGNPESSPATLQPLASLVGDLARFDHSSLRPYRPESYALRAREEILPGGCRPWTFPFPVDEALNTSRLVPASAAVDWPAGTVMASACAGDKRYSVTLRPLLPGERP